MIREVMTIHRTGNIAAEELHLSCGHNAAVDAITLSDIQAGAMKRRQTMQWDCKLCDTISLPPKPEKFPKMKPIPIAAAKRIAEEYGYDQVVVYGRRCGESVAPHGEHLTTYGRTKEHCSIAARMGDTLKKFMGWHA